MEIGVRSGCSTAALLAGIEEHGGHLWSVDINDCPVFAGHPNWTFRQADTLKEAETIKNQLPEALEMLFVDGDHTYEGALSDLMQFGPLAGKIFVHDTNAPDYPGVKQAVDEYVKATGRNVTFYEGSYGMAEIR